MSYSRHHELHVALTAEDAELLALVGLPPLKDTEMCSNCATDIGYTADGKFIPLALVLNEYEAHNLCLSCSAPVTRPRS